MIPTSRLVQSELPELFPVIVSAIHETARDIKVFELGPQPGSSLPTFTAGAHIAVVTPAGVTRHYSLCNGPDSGDRYRIAVKREARGRGGSVSMSDRVSVGHSLMISPPVNQFSLDPRARSVLLIAGGIGLTPLLAMAHSMLAEDNRRFRLIALTRDRGSTPLIDELESPAMRAQVTLHHDQGDPEKGFDLWPLLEKPGSLTGQHVYCCGPRSLMDAVRDMTGHWPASAVHFESFGVDTAPRPDDRAFKVRCRRLKLEFDVPVGRSILEVLREHGVSVPSSCESGTCGSCKTALLAGDADHRDLVLQPEAHTSQIMVCVSRAHSPLIELDL